MRVQYEVEDEMLGVSDKNFEIGEGVGQVGKEVTNCNTAPVYLCRIFGGLLEASLILIFRNDVVDNIWRKFIRFVRNRNRRKRHVHSGCSSSNFIRFLAKNSLLNIMLGQSTVPNQRRT